ncbi:MAG: hypothetical protein FRX48_08549 [Lasallia pustulata]|uniref:Heterokaryon incompatibility Het-C n=1 Tax=Lasallia pustulata TaxID=136370 RepID=A0A5M8PEH3_9LECA|nr:MAG: hypothetical protein FRX48_08549 [Lasallia pustulata]
MALNWMCLFLAVALVLQASPASAFGAGNIASISKLEGHNWRHGDIEDMLKTIAFLKGRKWTSMMVKRVYFGNWLRDYSQAVDVGTLKGVQSATIRILVWVLSFLSFGYATEEFEVTEERLGVYRPEEHIDNPKDYADNVDARKYDERLRPPVEPIELEIDPETGLKNYIANERLGIATSIGYVKFSFARSIHFARVYTSGPRGTNGKDADLYEALRCLGQGLHCLEDFGAHTNYTELALREQGFRDVFPHTGSATEINLQGHRVFPLVTGTFGAVDFLHSVLGEATDHFAQTEVDELNKALGDAQTQTKGSSGDAGRGFGGSGRDVANLTSLLSQVPGAGGLCQQAEQLRAQADAQEKRTAGDVARATNTFGDDRPPSFAGPPGAPGGPPGPGIPGWETFDPVKTASQIYPILEFRDKVVKAISLTLEKIPGLEALVEKITETVTLFVLSLLAPYIRPIINAVSNQLKTGSSTVIDASGKQQFGPWQDPTCSDPTHSMLSKDHFSNVLNEPAGQVASTILQYVAPRIIYAWQHPDIPVEQVLADVTRVFHHPAIRDAHCELHRNMFDTVHHWAQSLPDRGACLHDILSSEGVRQGRNHKGDSSNPNTTTHPPSAPRQPGPPPRRTPSAADSIAAAYPGTLTSYDNTRPPTGPSSAYESAFPSPAPPPLQHYHQDPYARPSYGHTAPQPDYGAPSPHLYQHSSSENPPPPAPYQQDYASGYQQGAPVSAFGGEYASAPGEYGGQPYGGDPNAPQAPQAPYGFGGPPHGQGQAGYYGGPRY